MPSTNTAAPQAPASSDLTAQLALTSFLLSVPGSYGTDDSYGRPAVAVLCDPGNADYWARLTKLAAELGLSYSRSILLAADGALAARLLVTECTAPATWRPVSAVRRMCDVAQEAA